MHILHHVFVRDIHRSFGNGDALNYLHRAIHTCEIWGLEIKSWMCFVMDLVLPFSGDLERMWTSQPAPISPGASPYVGTHMVG